MVIEGYTGYRGLYMVIDPTSDALLKPVELDKGETCAAQP